MARNHTLRERALALIAILIGTATLAASLPATGLAQPAHHPKHHKAKHHHKKTHHANTPAAPTPGPAVPTPTATVPAATPTATPAPAEHVQAFDTADTRTPIDDEVPQGGRGGAGDPGDDYPANLKNAAQDSLLDHWREYNRECTSFAAWALASRNGFNMPFYANARDWGAKARALGYRVDGTPAAGSIAWSNAGTYGHVAYVQDVQGSNVHIEEYNHDYRGNYSSRVVPISTFSGYIHFADRPAETTVAQPTTPAPTTPAPTTPPPTWAETVGGNANTWTNPANAGGTQGPTIPSNQTVQIACKLQGFKVADGNTWWYRIAQSPWNSAYYVSADAFYNNGATSGSLHGTPFVDSAVHDC